MIGHGEKLSRKQEQAIAALMVHSSIASAASSIDVGEETLRRWLRNPAFEAEYLSARRTVISQATNQLASACHSAVTALREVITDPMTSATAKVSAAKVILDMAYKAVEIDELALRIAELEEIINSMGG